MAVRVTVCVCRQLPKGTAAGPIPSLHTCVQSLNQLGDLHLTVFVYPKRSFVSICPLHPAADALH